MELEFLETHATQIAWIYGAANTMVTKNQVTQALCMLPGHHLMAPMKGTVKMGNANDTSERSLTYSENHVNAIKKIMWITAWGC